MNQIIHLESLEHPGEGVCGIVPNHRTEYHKVEDMDYIQNSMWPDDIICSKCKQHEDFILGLLGGVGEGERVTLDWKVKRRAYYSEIVWPFREPKVQDK